MAANGTMDGVPNDQTRFGSIEKTSFSKSHFGHYNEIKHLPKSRVSQ